MMLDIRDLEKRVVSAGKTGHLIAVFKGGQAVLLLTVGRNRGRNKDNPPKAELGPGSFRHKQVSQVNGVKGAEKEAGIKGFIQIRPLRKLMALPVSDGNSEK